MTRLHYLLNALFYILSWYLIIVVITEEYDLTRWRTFNQVIFGTIVMYQMIKIAGLESEKSN